MERQSRDSTPLLGGRRSGKAELDRERREREENLVGGSTMSATRSSGVVRGGSTVPAIWIWLLHKQESWKVDWLLHKQESWKVELAATQAGKLEGGLAATQAGKLELAAI